MMKIGIRKISQYAMALSLLVTAMPMAGQTCGYFKDCFSNVRGTVHDREDNTIQLEGAKVELLDADNQEHVVRTDEYGDYTIKNIRSGKATLTVKAKGYLKNQLELNIPDSGTKQVDVGMENREGGRVVSLKKWSQEATDHLLKLVKEQGYKNSKMMFVFWDETSNCAMPFVVTKFMTYMNQKMTVATDIRMVNRDEKISEAINSEIKTQRKNHSDFDKRTLVRLGKKYGANVVVYGKFEETKSAYDAFMTGFDVSKNISLPGFSETGRINRGDVSCQ
ncbi:carboxypeptidase regulatory-like domain-containing protein [Mariprofundus sp. EBB-1]|uniref:carboxypeptidase-like regulatory domain-containing protein n=1 Tax=Mariprofundus sp. EBB-1 TaxID=2650971 RepID=UPI000EF1E631|nr:carboxypeptidase-like regulatory domain-containing protein [Mariprofundus sp. EBB-1]RLL50853.1 carboxypeptidase regulatory-like domain-containing protein [Mariprofundus sp. EBB-1]